MVGVTDTVKTLPVDEHQDRPKLRVESPTQTISERNGSARPPGWRYGCCTVTVTDPEQLFVVSDSPATASVPSSVSDGVIAASSDW